MTRVVKIGGRPQLDPALPTALAVVLVIASGYADGETVFAGAVYPPRFAQIV